MKTSNTEVENMKQLTKQKFIIVELCIDLLIWDL